MSTNVEIESTLQDVVAGDAAGEYIVRGSWHELPIDPQEIYSCIISVKSLPGKFEWHTVRSLNTWATHLSRFGPSLYLIGTVDGGLIKIANEVLETLDTGLRAIHSIWGNSASDCWLAHRHGVSYWNGKKISRTFPSGALYQIHSPRPGFAVAVGVDRTVLKFDGADWKLVDSAPVNTKLTGVHCVSDKEIYICGWFGVLYLWNGADLWAKVDIPNVTVIDANMPLVSVVQYRGKIYVCAGQLGLFVIAEGKAKKVQDFYSNRSTVIDDKLIITAWNEIREFDGNFWKDATIKLPEQKRY